MKTNLFGKPNPPVIAYLDVSSIWIGVWKNGEVLLNRHNLVYDNSDTSFADTLAVSLKSKFILILGDELLLYSQQRLPLNLTDREIAELISTQKTEQGNSAIQTYYDYFRLGQQQQSIVLGLFEARKDTLDRVTGLLKNQGLVTSLAIPLPVVIINQIMINKTESAGHYYIVCKLNGSVFIVQINHQLVVSINQIHIAESANCETIYAEIDAYVDEVKAEHLIVIGLSSQNFDNQSLRFESIKISQNLAFQSILWMVEQHDLYQSVSMA